MSKNRIVKRVSMEDPEEFLQEPEEPAEGVTRTEDLDDHGVRIGDDMEDEPVVSVDPSPAPLIVNNAPLEATVITVDRKPLLARALPFLETFSRHGRGSRCPVCAQIIGHNENCKLAALIAEIEAVLK